MRFEQLPCHVRTGPGGFSREDFIQRNEGMLEDIVTGRPGCTVGGGLAPPWISQGDGGDCGLLLSSRLRWLRKGHQERAGTAGPGQAMAFGLLQVQVLREGPYRRVHQQVSLARGHGTALLPGPPSAASVLKCVPVLHQYELLL